MTTKADKETMTTTMLTDERVMHLWDTRVGEPCDKHPLTDADKLHFARAIEQAVLQSEQVQACKKDAQILDWLERHFTVVDGAYVDGNREAKTFRIDCEDDSFAEYKRNRIRDAVSAAMEKQP